jgi:hypothetical protein
MQKRVLILMLIFMAAISTSLSAAPVGYSINSDSGEDDSDGLYTIDLATGSEIQRIGTVQSLLQTRLDVEGLAFSPDGTLWGIDDETLKLFPIDTSNAAIDSSREVNISNIDPGQNDFGMTFACDNVLYVSSVTEQSLYRLALDGTATPIGSNGALGATISALAAYGNPVQLYGLGNGSANGQAGSSALYQINISTGVATEIGSLGAAAEDYAEGGLMGDYRPSATRSFQPGNENQPGNRCSLGDPDHFRAGVREPGNHRTGWLQQQPATRWWARQTLVRPQPHL